MSQSDREKWDRRYRDGAYATRKHPSALLTEWLPKLAIETEAPRVIDLACGIGRNALYLAQHGWRVSAVDVSGVALEKLAAAATDELDIRCTEMDLETGQPWPAELTAAGPFDLALMIRYTNLPLIAQLQEILKPGGYLLVEAHRRDRDGRRLRYRPGHRPDLQLRRLLLRYQLPDPDVVRGVHLEHDVGEPGAAELRRTA